MRCEWCTHIQIFVVHLHCLTTLRMCSCDVKTLQHFLWEIASFRCTDTNIGMAEELGVLMCACVA